MRKFLLSLLFAIVGLADAVTPPPALEGKMIFSTQGDAPLLPGVPVIFRARFKNPSNHASPAGRVMIRHCFVPPFQAAEKSCTFSTETQPLPSLNPGEEKELFFATTQTLPTISDFLRNNFGMRHYELLFTANGQSTPHLVQAVSLTHSVVYYPAVEQDFPLPACIE